MTAESIASNTPQVRQNQLLIDVSILMKHDLGTGIERVTRSVIKKLLDTPPEGYRVEPVYCDKDIFRYARRFTTKVLGIGEIPGFRDDKIEVQQGDIFLGLDWNPHNVSINKELFWNFRSHGVKIFFEVYDILPISYPKFFPPESRPLHEKWLQTIAEVAKYLKCSPDFIYKLTAAKEIPHHKNGVKFLRFRKSKIDKWLEDHNVPAVNTPFPMLKKVG